MKPPASDVPFWQSQTLRLTAIYLAVIMAMSLGFSGVLYTVSVGQLQRQMPGDVFIDEQGQFRPVPRVQRYLQTQIESSQRELLLRLVVLNVTMMLFGAAISYLLARKSLEPIERNMQAQSRFVSDVSHELRTPLTALQTCNEVTLRNKKLTLADARQVLADNLDEVGRLQRMTSTLLELLSDDVRLEVRPTNLHELVAKATTIVAPLALERSISLDDTTEDARVMVDSDAVVQALTALLDNAIKYSPDGATVNLRSTIKRQVVWLDVSDTGPGIAAEEQSRIFERFYRSDEARAQQGSGGYGLGLTIVKKIMDAHGGDVTLESKLGEGSSFRLVLPRAKKTD